MSGESIFPAIGSEFRCKASGKATRSEPKAAIIDARILPSVEDWGLRHGGVDDQATSEPTAAARDLLGAARSNEAASLAEDEDGGVVFVWGLATMSFAATDLIARRLAAVQLVETGTAKPGRWRAASVSSTRRFALGARPSEKVGVEALALVKKGPKRASKLTDDKRGGRSWCCAGLARPSPRWPSLPASLSAAWRGSLPDGPSARETEPGVGELVPLAKPEPRPAERQAARAGLLPGAQPRHLWRRPAARRVAPDRRAFSPPGSSRRSTRSTGTCGRPSTPAASLVLAFCFATLLGMGRAERAGRVDPASMGRLIGLDPRPDRRHPAAALRRARPTRGALPSCGRARHPPPRAGWASQRGSLSTWTATCAPTTAARTSPVPTSPGRDRDGGDHRHLAL